MTELMLKINKTNGQKYFQLWQKVPGENKYFYLRSLGTLEKLHSDLVKLDKLEKQTKLFEEIQTKILSDNNDKKDQRQTPQ